VWTRREEDDGGGWVYSDQGDCWGVGEKERVFGDGNAAVVKMGLGEQEEKVDGEGGGEVYEREKDRGVGGT
jgi:hypothetical protein